MSQSGTVLMVDCDMVCHFNGVFKYWCGLSHSVHLESHMITNIIFQIIVRLSFGLRIGAVFDEFCSRGLRSLWDTM